MLSEIRSRDLEGNNTAQGATLGFLDKSLCLLVGFTEGSVENMLTFTAKQTKWQAFFAVAIALLGNLTLATVAQSEPMQPGQSESREAIALPDGTHFYGQAPQQDQLNVEYMVFRVDQGQVNGAIYHVQSEYACFTGTVTPDALQLAVTDPYTDEVGDYAIAFQGETVIVAGEAQRQTSLKGYHALGELGELEQSLLAACTEQ